jgi:hypothetical protein
MLDLAEKIEGWQKWKCSLRQMSAIKAQVRVNHSGNNVVGPFESVEQ